MPNSNNQKKPAPAPTGILETNDPFEVIIFLLLAATIGGYIIERVTSFWQADESFVEAAQSYSLGLLPASIFISAAFIVGISYSIRQLTKLNAEMKLKFHSSKSPLPASPAAAEERVNKRWQKVLDYVQSPNMSDWKLSILEADILLEEMVDKIGYKGESLGEKLKSIEKSDFSTLDQAWEAHKIRNAIAHEGADFLITQGEARRVVGLFEEVFKEFKYI